VTRLELVDTTEVVVAVVVAVDTVVDGTVTTTRLTCTPTGGMRPLHILEYSLKVMREVVLQLCEQFPQYVMLGPDLAH
jgi:hypothetical protein